MSQRHQETREQGLLDRLEASARREGSTASTLRQARSEIRRLKEHLRKAGDAARE